MSRQPLPNRRPNLTTATDWNGHEFTVTVGFDAKGNPGEVFAQHAKGDMAAMLADACVLISIGLQHGITPEALAKSLGTVPAWINGAETTAPASPVGTILQVIGEATP